MIFNMRISRVKTFEVCVPTRIALRMTLSWLHFLTNRNAELAVLPFCVAFLVLFVDMEKNVDMETETLERRLMSSFSYKHKKSLHIVSNKLTENHNIV